MYINFHNYNSSLIDKEDQFECEKRDKLAYIAILKKWFEGNLDKIIVRKSEITGITYNYSGDSFLKLLLEAEELYALGFYTSCIALIAVSSKDFSIFIETSLKKNHKINRDILSDPIEQNENTYQFTQYALSNKDKRDLKRIKNIRNQCLHYDNKFKQKAEIEIKNDAFLVLNLLRNIFNNRYKYSSASVKSEVPKYKEFIKDDYKSYLSNWFNSNIENFVLRKWEIEEIFYLNKISDFIKLLREAEHLYEFGFFIGCISLIGISAEDFSKYISLEAGRLEHIVKNNDPVNQNDRLNFQIKEGLINDESLKSLDNIRRIRNGCFHFKNEFKLKNINELKSDALQVLNDLKIVLKNQIGCPINPDDFEELFDQSFDEVHSRSIDELTYMHRNMFSQIFNINVAHNPKTKKVIKCEFFRIGKLTQDEIYFAELLGGEYINTISINLNNKITEILDKQNLSEGDEVIATLVSEIDPLRRSSVWMIRKMQKVIRNHI
jgi:hypothetical protein